MTYAFADRIKNLKPSAIREIFKYAADPEVVSLSAGNPAPEAFPIKDIERISERIYREHPINALQYSVTEGYPALRLRMKGYMKSKHNVGCETDDILITAGAQQAMGLIAKVLCNPGDTVICECPSFVGALNSFRSLGAQLVGIPMDEEGMLPDRLEQALIAHPDTKFIYTIPNFQNPSGITMSWKRREQVYALARRFGVLIVEDNPYGDLRYAGEHVPAIKTLDTDGQVMYVGSFSKVLAPGLRVGYAIGNAALLQKMVVAKQGEDVHTNIYAQILCDEFMGTTDYEAHLTFLQDLYRDKAQLAMDLLDTYLVPLGITYHPIQGGLFLWCDLPERVNMAEFCTAAVRDYKVAVVPGNAFLAAGDEPCNSFRINFSTPTDEALGDGVRRLAVCAGNFLK